MAGGDCQPFSNFFWFRVPAMTLQNLDVTVLAFAQWLSVRNLPPLHWQSKWGTPETYGKTSKKNALVDQDSLKLLF
jgi:hypothetical protein